MIKHSRLFLDSLFYPKKLAAYRLLPIGKVLQYVFILITGITVFSLGQFIAGVSPDTLNMDGLTEYIENIKWLLYPFAFLLLFVMTTLLQFLRISLYAVVGFLFVYLLKKRAEYRQLWRTSAFAMTWATLLSIIFSVTAISGTIVTIISIATTLIILWLAISKYPNLVK